MRPLFLLKGPVADVVKAYCATLWWKWWSFFCFFILMEHRWNNIDRGKRSTLRKTGPSATLSTINPTWTYPGLNPCLRGERPATNRLSHGTDYCVHFLYSCPDYSFCNTNDREPAVTLRGRPLTWVTVLLTHPCFVFSLGYVNKQRTGKRTKFLWWKTQTEVNIKLLSFRKGKTEPGIIQMYIHASHSRQRKKLNFPNKGKVFRRSIDQWPVRS
jgi:hypothetical protein